MTPDELRALLIVDNAPHPDRFTLYIAHEDRIGCDILLVPPTSMPETIKWGDDGLALVREIFPTASRFTRDGSHIAFTISGNDRVLLTLMERGEEPFCTVCEGGGWVLANIPSSPPPSFFECQACCNPFEFPCP